MVVLATAGHVDHGKSTLVQRLTGIDPDRWAEEKRRGLTIDLGFAWLLLPDGTEVGIVDVPGHERFVTNMLAGVGPVPAVLFVVDAGEGWKPQSEEHLAILDLLDVQHAVIALTKCDAVDGETIERRGGEIRAQLGGTALTDAPIVPVSARTGAGIDALLEALAAMIAAIPPVPPRRVRLFVDRSFTIGGAGTVVTGTLAEGTLAVGDEVAILPGARRARIRGIQAHRSSRETLAPVARAAVNLVGVRVDEVERGDALVGGPGWRVTQVFDARVRAARGADVVQGRAGFAVHLGTAEVPARIRFLDGPGARGSLAAGEIGLARISLRDPVPIVALDRFILRDTGRRRVVAGGVVLDPASRADRSLRRSASMLRVRAEARSADELVALILSTQGWSTPADLLAVTGTDVLPADAERIGEEVWEPGAAAVVRAELAAAVTAAHEAAPLAPAVARDVIRQVLGFSAARLEAFAADPRTGVVVEGGTIRRRDHVVALAPADEAAASRIIATVRAGGLRPPDRGALDAADVLLDALLEAGRLVEVGPELLFAPEVVADARARVREAVTARPQTTSELRALLDTSRKYAIPLLERFDAEGVTRFDGNVRVLGEPATGANAR